MRGLVLEIQTDADGQLTGEGEEAKFPDSQRGEFDVERPPTRLDILRVVHPQQGQVRLHPCHFLHGLDVLHIGLHRRAIADIEGVEVGAPEDAFLQVSGRILRGEIGIEPVPHDEGQKCLQVERGAPQGLEQPLQFSLLGFDPVGEIGPGQLQGHAKLFELRVRFGANLAPRLERGEGEQIAKRFGVAGTSRIFICHRVDVATAALHKECHGIVPQHLFDDLGRKTGQVGRIAP